MPKPPRGRQHGFAASVFVDNSGLSKRILLGVALLALAAVAAWRLLHQNDPLPGFPATMLFADDRSEDLRFLDPKEAGIVYLARTVILGATGISVRPRLSTLDHPPGTALMAVVRIELT